MEDIEEGLIYIKNNGMDDDDPVTEHMLATLYDMDEYGSQFEQQVAKKMAKHKFPLRALEYLKKCDENDESTTVSSYLYHILWHITAKYESFGKACLDADFVSFLQDRLDVRLNSPIFLITTDETQASVNILQNIIILNPQCRQLYSEKGIVQTVAQLCTHSDEQLRYETILLVMACVTEEEAKQLHDSGYIEHSIKRLRSEIRNIPNRTNMFFDTKTLLFSSVNDVSKREMVDKGALPLLVLLMTSKEVKKIFGNKILVVVAKTIWNLCFQADTKDQVIKQRGCVDALRTLAKSEDVQVSKAASGALWMVEGKAKHERAASAVVRSKETQEGKHIFISYSWKTNKDTVHKVASQLKKDGYKVWLDIDKMKGSTLEAMANAIENAYICLMFYSESYRVSENCRLEGEYVHERRVPIIPLRMQKAYKADGWLGIKLGSKLYIDFHDGGKFGESYKALIVQLKKQK